MVLDHTTLGLFSQVSEVLLKPSRDLICSVKCWVCFRVASTAHGVCPSLCNLSVLGLALIDLKLSLDRVLLYELNTRQKCTVTCTWEVLSCVCTGSDSFITLLSIREHTPRVELPYSSVLVSLIFTGMFSFVPCLIGWSTYQKSS